MGRTRRRQRGKTRKNRTRRQDKSAKLGFYRHEPKPVRIGNYHVLFLPLATSATVRVECSIQGGHWGDAPGKAGVTHLLEHMMASAWKGCKNSLCPGLAKRGIVTNALVSSQYTSYFATGRSADVGVMLDYLANIVVRPRLTKSALVRERKAIKAELLRLLANPMRAVSDALGKLIYPARRYQSLDPREMLRVLPTLTLRDVERALHRTHSAPCMLFAVSGKYDRNAVEDALARLLRARPGRCPRICQPGPVPTPDCFRWTGGFANVPGGTPNTCRLAVAFPAVIGPAAPDFALVGLLQMVLGNGLESLLVRRLRVNMGLVYTVAVTAHSGRCGTVVEVRVVSSVDKAWEILVELLRTLMRYTHELVPAKLLASAKSKLLTHYASVCKGSSAAVMSHYLPQYFSQLGSAKPTIRTLGNVYDTVASAKRTTLRGLMRKVFVPEHSVIVNLSPRPLLGPRKKKVTWEDIWSAVG